MPPYSENRTVWNNVRREVTVDTDTRGKKTTHSVQVTFTRVGYNTATQQPVEEVLATDTVATKLTLDAAQELKRNIQLVCDHTYTQGYSAARNGHTI